jgi:L-2-hydroxycarboxylate dehydrogenase (NAD+)
MMGARPMDDPLYPAPQLQAFAARVFQHFGVPAPEAERAAEVLIAADLRGVDSHGIVRLRLYAGMFAAGRLNPRANVRVVRSTLSTATVDGDNGLGLDEGTIALGPALASQLFVARVEGSPQLTTT